jgi:hypothetical protein
MDENKHESTSPKTAGQKAAGTKGRIERVREAKMAAWTRKNGKNDALNPYSKQNYPGFLIALWQKAAFHGITEFPHSS